MMADNHIYDAEQQMDSLRYRREKREQRTAIRRRCETCKYFGEDFSVGAAWCDNDDPRWTDEEIVKYFEDSEDGCPYWEEAEADMY